MEGVGGRLIDVPPRRGIGPGPHRGGPPNVFPGEPDNDMWRPPGRNPDDYDDDYGMNPFGGGPYGGGPFGGGGVGGVPGRGGPRPPPGYNPDWERDLNPLGGPQFPPRGGGQRGPPGPFNPTPGFGGGGFGGGPMFH